MIHLYGKLPKGRVGIAFSGGVDSVALAHFVSRTRDVTLYHFNHDPNHSNDNACETFCKAFADAYNVPLVVGYPTKEKPPKTSIEAWWREQRYAFLHKVDMPVLTGHHLDDVAETWMFGAMHGQPKLIPYQNKNVLRPFLLNTKQELIAYASERQLIWHEDSTNADLTRARNRIRHNIMPEVLKINSGFYKVLIKKLKEKLHKGS